MTGKKWQGVLWKQMRVAAFTLIEIMVVMALLTVIVIGLMAMFNQTQKAFRAGMAQTDQLEGGRMFTDLLVRDLQQITPTFQTNGINFYTQIPDYAPLQQVLPANSYSRTDLLENLFFMSRYNQTWSGIGYFVRTNTWVGGNMSPVGTLYRFETNVTSAQITGDPYLLFQTFLNATNNANISKILDGVVEFRVRAYDPNGFVLTNGSQSIQSNFFVTITNSFTTARGEVEYSAYSNNIVPAFVEVQVGVIEPAVLKRYNSIPGNTPGGLITRSNFLATHAGNVQLFRQRIAIRNVDPSAYNP
jgi:type II secretory pathway pseudopilin PulG